MQCYLVYMHVLIQRLKIQPDNTNIELNVYYSGNSQSSVVSQSGLSDPYHTTPFVFCLIITVPRVGIYLISTFTLNKQNPMTSKLAPTREYLSRNRKAAHGTGLPPEVTSSLRFLAFRCCCLHCGQFFTLHTMVQVCIVDS